MTKTREIVAFMVIAALGASLMVAGLFLPGIPKNVATKADVRSAIQSAQGEQAVKRAEAEIESQVVSNGGTVVGFQLDHTAVQGDKTFVFVVVKFETPYANGVQTLRVKVTLDKSVYQVTGIERA